MPGNELEANLPRAIPVLYATEQWANRRPFPGERVMVKIADVKLGYPSPSQDDDPSSVDFFAGRDPELEAALNYKRD